MSPLVKKEIRLLLPAWIAAMLMATVPAWIAPVWSRVPPEVNPYVQPAFALGFLLLGIASFGQEFSSGTFSLLLSQPIERRRLWIVKIVVLAGAFVSVLLALLVSWTVHFYLYDFALYQHRPRTGLAPVLSWNLLAGLSLFAAVCFSGGLWATVLLRRILEAFWLTILAPLAILVGLYALQVHFNWSNQTGNCIISAVFLLYSAAGFFWARRLFLRAQDLQWTGREIAFPTRKGILERTIVSGRGYWLYALARKELQMHQGSFLIAGIVLILHLASVLVRRFHPDFTNSTIQGFIELVWVLWLIMPLLIGGVAVAEERRFGTFESQLCLPVSRGSQFFIKFFVTLFLSLVLGGLMPLAIERSLDFNLWIFVIAAAFFFISFYGSTVARTTLQAIGVAIIIALVIYFHKEATTIRVRFGPGFSYEPLHEQAGLALLRLYFGVPILVLVLVGMMFWNFKWYHSDRKLRWRNGIAVLASLILISACTNAVYFRVWELLTPLPSPHGPARLTPSDTTKLNFANHAISAVLPDGRLWIETLTYDVGRFAKDRLEWMWYTLAQAKCTTQFVGGSNWVDAADWPFGVVAVQSSGRLWFLPEEFALQHNEDEERPQIGRPVQIGSDENWLDAAGGRLGGSGCLLLKRDGTLWNWGAKWASHLPEVQALNLATPPSRIGDDTNWVEVFSSGYYAGAKKNDGSLWFWEPTGTMTNNTYRLVQETNFAVSVDDISFGDRGWPVEVKANGELWLSWRSGPTNGAAVARKIELGQNAKWKAVAILHNSIMAMRTDGTLWRWSLASVPGSVRPEQVGNYSGWIVLRGLSQNRSALALAADGSLWIWDEPSRHIWLAPSRKPVYLGNIFSAQ